MEKEEISVSKQVGIITTVTTSAQCQSLFIVVACNNHYLFLPLAQLNQYFFLK